jgi:hypothetical protein
MSDTESVSSVSNCSEFSVDSRNEPRIAGVRIRFSQSADGTIKVSAAAMAMGLNSLHSILASNFSIMGLFKPVYSLTGRGWR